ncbi:MAG: hypothetical protein RLP02_27625 [Coleofasciculus sp. C2-GNP5-27]
MVQPIRRDRSVDGTMRFLALAVLELDPEAQGLLCLEELEDKGTAIHITIFSPL